MKTPPMYVTTTDLVEMHSGILKSVHRLLSYGIAIESCLYMPQLVCGFFNIAETWSTRFRLLHDWEIV